MWYRWSLNRLETCLAPQLSPMSGYTSARLLLWRMRVDEVPGTGYDVLGRGRDVI